MGKKARIKRARKEKTAASESDAGGAAAFRFGMGSTPVYLDAETNHAIGIELADGAPQRVSGYFKHTPSPSADKSYAYVREMHIGRPGGPMPESTRVSECQTSHTWFSYDPGLPGRRCACGFESFIWQKTCPKCVRRLQADPGPRG